MKGYINEKKQKQIEKGWGITHYTWKVSSELKETAMTRLIEDRHGKLQILTICQPC